MVVEVAVVTVYSTLELFRCSDRAAFVIMTERLLEEALLSTHWNKSHATSHSFPPVS